MQRERSALDPFPEPIDLNQGTFPKNTCMDHSASCDNVLNPVENRLSNYMLTAADGNAGFATANDHAHSFSGWDKGESSSSRSHFQDAPLGNDSKMKHGWSASANSFSSTEARSGNWSSRPSNISTTGNHVTGRSLSMHNYTSNHGSLSTNPNHGLSRVNDYRSGHVASIPHSLHKSSHSETEQILTLCASTSNIGTSGDFTFPEANDAPGPSFSSWGTSCKRKALEGTSGQFCAGGSSSSSQPLEKNAIHHPVSDSYTVPGNSSVSAGSRNFSPSSRSEQLNPSIGISMSVIATGAFPSSVPGLSESSAINFAMRSNPRHGIVPCDAPIGTSARNFGAYDANILRPISNIGSSEMMSPQTPPMTQPYLQHVNEARRMHSHPWNGSFSSRGVGPSGSSTVSGERGSSSCEEVNVRRSRRSNLEAPMAVYPSETTNILHDQIDWSYDPGISLSSRNLSSSSQNGSASSGQASLNAWLPYQNPMSQNHHRMSEPAPWISFPRVESASGVRRNHLAHFPSAAPSSDEGASTSRAAQHQLPQNSAAFLMDVQGGDFNGWRSMTAFESRYRMIRQVLSAMRRSGRVQAEDFMLLEPMINGFAELHDRHRDMRLDVDNMSYEELLALEERIGNVSTGLGEEKIGAFMRQQKYEAMGVAQSIEPCCICQEDYITGDDIGTLDCGHQFHSGCIKQWLKLKNICPICKTTALEER